MQKPQLDSLEKLKRLVSSVPVLQFFNPNLPTRIRTDSSSVGLGAILDQCVNEIVYNYELLLKGQQIIIPKSMRREIRDLIHQGHQGIEKCKSRARQAVYWPGMNHELSVLVSQCRHQKESLIPTKSMTNLGLKSALTSSQITTVTTS